MDNGITFTLSTEEAGQRLDSCLVSRLSDYSRAQVASFIKIGAIRVYGEKSKPSLTVKGLENVSFELPEPVKSNLIPQDLPLDIIYSDQEIAVINKPAGMVVHPGAGISSNTLCNALIFHFPTMTVGNCHRPGIVHRLDKDTSGLLVIAKTHEAHQFLSLEFKAKQVKKIYRAWCHNHFDVQKLDIKSGHRRHPKHPLKFFTNVAVPLREGSGIRFAHTGIEVLHQTCGIAELKVFLHTGRTHQIRAHMADNGHPLLGDTLYGGVKDLKKPYRHDFDEVLAKLRGQALHAEHLTFRHPKTKEIISFQAPLPEHLKNLHETMNALLGR